MLPRRFKIVPAYVAALCNGALSSRSAKFSEILRYLFQRSETKRGRKYVRAEGEEEGFLRVEIDGLGRAVHYPAEFGRAGF